MKDVKDAVKGVEGSMQSFTSNVQEASRKGLKVAAVEIPTDTLFRWLNTLNEIRFALEKKERDDAAKAAFAASGEPYREPGEKR